MSRFSMRDMQGRPSAEKNFFLSAWNGGIFCPFCLQAIHLPDWWSSYCTNA
jgi:hypothetical protein